LPDALASRHLLSFTPLVAAPEPWAQDAFSVCPPLLKWPGGKRQLLPHIARLVPHRFERYFEPFLGGGAVFFAIRPHQAFLSDSDAELINCYIQVRDETERVIARLSALRNTEMDYYRVRASRPRTAVGQATRTIYLATLSFNGIHRKNTKGDFNVPYGHKRELRPCDRPRIRATARALRAAHLSYGDFASAITDAKRGDVVYLDPPYTVAHGHNGFLKYNAKIFSWSDQLRLAAVADELASRGCKVIVSNADHVSIRRLYRGFTMLRVARASRIAASVEFRRSITECLFYS
jgi:DNA adenine methylase